MVRRSGGLGDGRRDGKRGSAIPIWSRPRWGNALAGGWGRACERKLREAAGSRRRAEEAAAGGREPARRVGAVRCLAERRGSTAGKAGRGTRGIWGGGEVTGLECGMSLDGREELEGHIDGPAAPTAQRRVDRRLALPAEKCDVSPGEGGARTQQLAAAAATHASGEWQMARCSPPWPWGLRRAGDVGTLGEAAAYGMWGAAYDYHGHRVAWAIQRWSERAVTSPPTAPRRRRRGRFGREGRRRSAGCRGAGVLEEGRERRGARGRDGRRGEGTYQAVSSGVWAVGQASCAVEGGM